MPCNYYRCAGCLFGKGVAIGISLRPFLFLARVFFYRPVGRLI